MVSMSVHRPSALMTRPLRSEPPRSVRPYLERPGRAVQPANPAAMCSAGDGYTCARQKR